jgi:hypothetical protein
MFATVGIFLCLLYETREIKLAHGQDDIIDLLFSFKRRKLCSCNFLQNDEKRTRKQLFTVTEFQFV